MLLFYVRHGEPIYKPDQLTYLGEMQAEAVGKRLARLGMDKIYSSTSTRAFQTAEPLAKMLRKEITQLSFCHESAAFAEFSVVGEDGKRHWGFETPAVKKMFVSPEVRALGDRWYEYPHFPENGFRKGTERVRRETHAFLRELGYEYDKENRCYRELFENNERIALFAHDGFGRIFLSTVLDIPYPLYSVHFAMFHSTVTVIEFKNQEGAVIPQVLSLGNDGHIYREGLPLAILGQKF